MDAVSGCCGWTFVKPLGEAMVTAMPVRQPEGAASLDSPRLCRTVMKSIRLTTKFGF